MCKLVESSPLSSQQTVEHVLLFSADSHAIFTHTFIVVFDKRVLSPDESIQVFRDSVERVKINNIHNYLYTTISLSIFWSCFYITYILKYTHYLLN